jgi:hypothetical protein
LSRSYAYTYHRPWRLLWYVLFAGFLAVTSMFAVKLFASSAIALGNWSIAWGLDQGTMRSVVAPRPPVGGTDIVDPVTPSLVDIPANEEEKATAPTATPKDTVPLSKLQSATASIVRFWKLVVAVLVAGYQVGFLWVSAVGIYLLLRRDIDGVQMDEVYVEPVEEFGVPPLATDPATGVPGVDPHGEAQPGDLRT